MFDLANIFSEVTNFATGNAKALALGAGAAFVSLRASWVFNRVALYRGYLFDNDVLFTTTDYLNTPKKGENDEPFRDQFIDTKGNADLASIYNGSSGKAITQYIQAAKRKAMFGTTSKIAVPFQIARRLFSKDPIIPEGTDNIWEILGDIIDDKVSDPHRRFRLKREARGKMINYIRTNIDIMDGIFDLTPNGYQDRIETDRESDDYPLMRHFTPVMILEKHALITKLRVFLVRDYELEEGYMPEAEQVRVHKGTANFEVDRKSHLMERHRTMSNAIEYLQSDAVWMTNPDSEIPDTKVGQAFSITIPTP